MHVTRLPLQLSNATCPSFPGALPWTLHNVSDKYQAKPLVCVDQEIATKYSTKLKIPLQRYKQIR